MQRRHAPLSLVLPASTVALLGVALFLGACEKKAPPPPPPPPPQPVAVPEPPRVFTSDVQITGPNAASVYDEIYEQIGPASWETLRQASNREYVDAQLDSRLSGAQPLIERVLAASEYECDFDVDYGTHGVETELPHLKTVTAMLLLLRVDAIRLSSIDPDKATERVLAMIAMSHQVGRCSHTLAEWDVARMQLLTANDTAHLLARRGVFEDGLRRSQLLEAFDDLDREDLLGATTAIERYAEFIMYCLEENKLDARIFKDFEIFADDDRAVLAATVEEYYDRTLQIWYDPDPDLKFEKLRYDYQRSRVGRILVNCGFMHDNMRKAFEAIDETIAEINRIDP